MKNIIITEDIRPDYNQRLGKLNYNFFCTECDCMRRHDYQGDRVTGMLRWQIYACESCGHQVEFPVR